MNRFRKIIAFSLGFYIGIFPFTDQCFAGGYGNWLTDLKGENAGHTVGYFLALPVSAGELAQGASSSCGSMDATDVCFFPANTSLFDRKTFSVTHLEWLMGLRKEFCCGAFPIEDIGTLGFFSQLFTPGQFNNAFTIDEVPSHPSLIDFSAGLSIARNFFHKSLSTGISLSYVESRLDANSGRTVCVNTDVSYAPSPLMLLHVRAGNIGPSMVYTPGFPEPLPLQAGTAVEIRPLATREDLLSIVEPRIGLGVNKIADEPLLLGLSGSGTFLKFISLRCGYEFAFGTQADLPGLSAGIGVDRQSYGADFGWKNQSKDFGSVWSLSVNVRLKEAIAKRAEDFYFLALGSFKKGNLRQSLNNAKKAVALDPNMWKAHTLISEINALKRRSSGVEMALLYSGNSQGHFVPRKLGNGSLGGMARLASAIGDLRAQFPLTLTIDAGNNLIQSSHEAKAGLADWFFEQIAYDARGLGKGEIDFGLDRLFTKNRKSKGDFICSNMAGPLATGIVGKKIVTVGGYSFALLAMVGQTSPARAEDQGKLLSPVEELSSLLLKSAVKKADVRVLIANDSWERITAAIQELPQIDVVLCGGIKQKFETPMKIGNALVISPGDGGYCVGKLIIRFDGNKKIVSTDNHLISLTEDITPDSVVAGQIPTAASVQDDSGDASAEISGDTVSSSGVFAFMSDRDGTDGIYLKRLDRQAEFPLTRGKGACSTPTVSFAGGACAYFERQSDTTCPALRTMDLSGVNKWTIPFTGCITEACFSPDGKWLYFSGRTGPKETDIFRIKPGSGVVAPVITWKTSSEGSMIFSDNGKYLAFTSTNLEGRQLFLTDSSGFRPICLTEGKADQHAPRFSLSGEYLAFLSNKTTLSNSYDLWVHTLATGTMSQLTFHAQVKDYCWLDDAKTIVYSAGDTQSCLKILSIGSEEGRELIGAGVHKNYSELHPRIVRWRKATKIIYTRQAQTGERKIFWVNPDGTGDQRLVNSKGQDWLE
jgi:Tol biopolymer transport system component